MTEEHTLAIDYFSASEDYFWRWAENGRVIEFVNKKTICYREDLAYLLGELPAGSRLPLGTILLLLCACKENWESLFEIQQQLMRLSLAPSFSSEEYLRAEQMKNDAYHFLKVVNSLPLEQRGGIRRTALIKNVMSVITPDMTIPDIRLMVKTLNSGEIDYWIFKNQNKLDFDTVRRDLSPLVEALKYLPDKEALELKLKTGLITLPKAVPIDLPEENGEDLLGQLEEDNQTRLLSHLTRKILAAVRIPMYLSGSSDYALGGVADIANRGNYDQLLLSELAQEDVMLTARLANNEALFLKRETPPDNAIQELGIFMDMSLKMWGMPRVLAIATGLAFREAKLKNQQLKVWGLGGSISEIDLDTKKGVINALEVLDPELQFGEQLVNAVRTQSNKKGKYVLITAEGFLQDPAISAYFHRIRENLDFLVTVNRNGHIQLIRLTKGRQQLLNEARITLDELFYRSAKTTKRHHLPLDLPAIMLEETFPLYYPTSKIKMKQANTHVGYYKQIIVVTQDRRVLCWATKGKGAVELIDCLPQGSFCFGETHTDIYLLVSSEKSEMVRLYFLDTAKEIAQMDEIPSRQYTAQGIKFINHEFYLSGPQGLDLLSLESMKIQPGDERDVQMFRTHQPVIQYYKNFTHLKKQINTGYSVINSAKMVYIHTAGKLFIDRREFKVDGDKFLWKENALVAVEWVKPISEEPVYMEHLPNIKFTKFTWKSGSVAILDSRGVLHLKAQERNIPEVSILLVVDKPTACWSADGVVSGSNYFTGRNNGPQTEPSIFYKNYIQRFIDTLN